MTKAELRRAAMALPLQPGVYIMKDKADAILYIGKAKALKNRVSQYFGSDTNHSPKVRRMVEKVHHFEYLVVGSEFEALVLECALIKQHRPPYNILLKDDKGYHYIRVSPPPYSRIEEAKQKKEDGAQYLGPYMSGWTVRQSVAEACRIFGLATCHRPLAPHKACGRPCLNHHIGQCCAPCTGRVDAADYQKRVNDALQYLQKGSGQTVKELTEQMTDAAEALDFERAARLRDRIAAIRRVGERQHVVLQTHRNCDVIAAVRGDGKLCFQVLCFRDGQLCAGRPFVTEASDELPAARAEFIRRYYSMQPDIPPEVLLDGAAEDMELTERWLSEGAGRRVHLSVPQKGEAAKAVTMCRDNAAEHLARQSAAAGRTVRALDEIAQLLGLAQPPARIECFDISHTAGAQAVAGMVVFQNGKPLRRDYRRFAVDAAHAGDDAASMREVVGRRLQEYLDGNEAFAPLPDLLLLDGGDQQVAAVAPLLQGRALPLFGLVKDGKHRTAAITDGGQTVDLRAKPAAFALLTAIQDEVHRFAITYHRQKRDKGRVETVLTQIEGIGPAKASALLRQFGSVQRIAAAAPEALCAVRGITPALAQQIKRQLPDLM